jgi:hypothetical protein
MIDSVPAAALAGLLAGLVHALSGPDHLSAVAPLVVGGRDSRRSWVTGLLWGTGHGLGVFAVGGLALLLRGVLPVERLSSWSERMVGAVLIAVGLWGLRRAYGSRLGAHGHVHAPSGRPRAALWVGTLHGLAGSSHILGLFPAFALARAASIAYVGGFGLGAVAAMVGFSSVLGVAAVRLSAHGGRGYQTLLAGCSAASIVLGGFWLMS